ncbi:MAG: P1 family peptidase [Gammaproteobacteria bacterium]|nr:P1 family peptidase [Gammaproteobacteria bacterium]
MTHRDIARAVLAVVLASSIQAQTPVKTNDDPDLVISTDPGRRVLAYDFPAFHVGIAEYPDGPTGVTVLHFPNGAGMALDVRGGSPGVVGDYGYVHAISLAGGSLPGLEAASGVAAELLARGGDKAEWSSIPLVSGGIVFDFGTRNNRIYPDKRLGRAALKNALPNRFPLGARGAGISVTVGNGFSFDRGEPAGQGAAYREIGGVKFFACVVLNAIGAVFDRNGNIVRGHVDPESGARMTYMAEIERQAAAARAAQAPQPGNTTITVVVVNQTVRGHDLIQLGRQVHSSMARAIQPFHTRDDGDALWMVSTGEVEVPQWSTTGLGVVASEVVWDAVLVAHP